MWLALLLGIPLFGIRQKAAPPRAAIPAGLFPALSVWAAGIAKIWNPGDRAKAGAEDFGVGPRNLRLPAMN